jgi:hypothetical protein
MNFKNYKDKQMKLTKEQLRQIIKEELSRALKESDEVRASPPRWSTGGEDPRGGQGCRHAVVATKRSFSQRSEPPESALGLLATLPTLLRWQQKRRERLRWMQTRIVRPRMPLYITQLSNTSAASRSAKRMA